MRDSTQSANLAQAYNDLPYTSKVFSYCQPTRLHALAKMKGLDPAPLETAKVLEIGCSFGGNLLPYAIRYPNSQLVGIDLSEHQINIGRQMMQFIGINNVELISADISQVSFNIKFDYIICHGVFSWVPEPVRQAILRTIKDYLLPNGIAFISYNVYPGWKIKEIAKDLMLFGSNVNLPSIERIEQSFGTLEFTRSIWERKNLPLSKEVGGMFNEIISESKYYIAHEYFEEYNQPLYFKDFIHQISQYNLAYVTDSSKPIIFSRMMFKDNEFGEICNFFNHQVEGIEQYLDFLENRQFRTSIITHRANLEARKITNNIEQYSQCHGFYDLYFHINFKFFEKTDEREAHWTMSNGIEFLSIPLYDALFNYLQLRNEPCQIRDIFNHLSPLPEYDEKELINIIFHIIHFEWTYLCCSLEKQTSYQEKPKIIEQYRKFIQFICINPNITHLSNKYFVSLQLDFFSQHLSQYLDGSRTIDDLVIQIRNDIANDIIALSKDDERKLIASDVSDSEIRQIIIRSLDILEHNGYFNTYVV